MRAKNSSGYTFSERVQLRVKSTIVPTSGSTLGGTAVTITGSGFVAGSSVTIGGVAWSVVVVNSTTITAETGAHAAGAVDVVVTTPGVLPETLTGAYTYVTPGLLPTISTIAPASGSTAGGTPVTIAGTGFATNATVTIGGVAATSVVFVNATTITAVTGAHAAGAVDVVVTNPGAAPVTLAGAYTYVTPGVGPSVTRIEPASGTTAGGTAVTITGTGFVAGAVVSIGGVATTNRVVMSATTITVVTGAHAAGPVSVVVTNPDAQSATLASAFTYTASAPTETWSTKAAMPTARNGLGVGVVSGVLYATGGCCDGSGYLATVEAYDPATNTFSTKAAMPTARDLPGVGVVNGVLYAVGGAGRSGLVAATVEAYNPATNTWSAKAAMPTARYGLGVGVVNGVLYAVGGYNYDSGGCLATVEAYDPATNAWSTKAAMPTAREYVGVGVVDGVLYAVGGSGSGDLATVEAYDPATDTWSTKGAMPTARWGLGVGVVNGVLYAAGGYGSSGYLATVEAYDPATNTWSTKAAMPTARVHLGVGVVNGVLYAVGGGGGGGDLATVEAYTASNSESNSAPTATVLSIAGTLAVGQVLTGHYTYADVDGDAEGTSTFRWLRGGVAVSGATALTYTTVVADSGQTLTFEVTPVAGTGTSPGSAATTVVTIAVGKATPLITWANPAAIVHGTLLSGIQLNATASFGGAAVEGAFVYDPPADAVLNVGAGQTLSATFTPTDAASYTTATARVTIDVTASAAGPFTQQGSKLLGSGTGADGVSQGYSVSLSADGNTAIVGAYDHFGAGGAWVWTRNGGVWTQQGIKLVGSDFVGIPQGRSVALSGDGNTAIVAGKGDNGGTGAAWVWTRSGGVWTQQGTKLVGSGSVQGSEQGYSVSLSADGNTAIVGAVYDNSQAGGAAWIWTRSAGVWTQQGSKLVGSGAVGSSYQGGSVSLSGDGNTAIVGGNGDSNFAGAAWVWTRSGGVWSQQGTKLVGSGAVGNASQGSSVSLSTEGNTAIVGGYLDNGGAGAAWVWTRVGGVWIQQGTKLVGSGAVGTARQGGSVSLSADGNVAVVGGNRDNSDAGAAWLWTRSAGVWTQLGSKLVGLGAAGNANQGWAVSISGDGNTTIVGGFTDNNSAGAAWVFTASGSVDSAPAITAQPSNQAVTVGGDASFSVAANGTPTPTFQWQVSTNGGATWTNLTNTSPYSGVTSSSLTVSATPLSLNGAQYRAVATNGVGTPASSNAATLTVSAAAMAPTVTTDPSNRTVTAGATASFEAAASGTPTPTVQWQVSTNSGSTWSDISGATSTTYAFTTALADSGKQFHAVFTNSAGTATTNAATLTVNAAPVAPSVTTQPSNQTVTAGTTATFTAAASGSPTPTVQWQVSTNSGTTWTDISGATSTTYAFTTALADSGKQFHAVFTNSAGTATTNAATLTVNAAPVVTTQPTAQTVTAGATATFTAAASGTPTPTVQWQVSTNSGTTWSDISGATSTTYAFTTALADSGKQYHAVFTNSAGTATTIAATLTVNAVTSGGGLDQSFNPGANGAVRAIVLQADGQIVVGGEFWTLGGGDQGTTNRNGLGRLHADGSLDMTFDPGANNSVFALAKQADGKILVVGQFSALGGGGQGTTSRNSLGRLNADGSLDASFDPGANGPINTVAVQADGKILVGGAFTMLGGGGTGTTPRARLGRLNADGSLDASFDPGADQVVNALVVQADGKIVVGGQFTTLGGGSTGVASRHYLGRLNADGSLDASFDPGANNLVETVAVQADGKILVGGWFSTLGGGGTGTTMRRYLGRLDASGALDASFDPGANGWVESFAQQADGKILVGGWFSTFGGGGTGTTTRNALARLNVDGSLDPNFDPGANHYVDAITVQPDGKILVGGIFTTLGGGGTGTTTRNRIGRLNGDAVNAAPSVTTQPSAQTVTAGTTATFTAAASGTPTPTVQWQVSTNSGTTWSDISGATSTTYAFTTALADSGTQFHAVFTNSAGTATTNAATLTVNAAPVAPSVTTQPSNQTVTAGATATFTAAASGTPTPTVQWQVSTNSGATWSDINGATSTTYGFTTALADSGKQFHAVFTNSGGTATTNAAMLTVNAAPVAPVVTPQPSAQTVTVGATATFTAAASGTPTPTVQWQVSTSSGSTWSDINGATSTTYAFTTALADSGKQYHAVFTNGGGTATSNAATLTVGRATPVITWANPSAIMYGTALSSTQLNATAAFGGASVAGTFVYTPPSGTVLAASLGQTLSVTFTPTDATNYAGATKTVTIDVTATSGRPTFTDDPLIADQTTLKVVHITELRQAIDTLRARYQLSTFTWTTPSLSAGTSPIRAIHLVELRTALDAVFAAANRTVPSYTHTVITGGTTPLTALDISELRAAILAIW